MASVGSISAFSQNLSACQDKVIGLFWPLLRLTVGADDQHPLVETSNRTVCQTCGDSFLNFVLKLIRCLIVRGAKDDCN